MTAVIAILVSVIAVRSFYQQTSISQIPGSDNTSSRVDELKTRLDEEIEKRIELQQQFDEERRQRLSLENRVQQISFDLQQNSGAVSLENQAPLLNRSSFGLPAEEEQINTLVNAGFEAAIAERIVSLETEMYQTIVRARFGGTTVNPREVVSETQRTLRQELGDDQYELYLQSTGRPTTVPVAAIGEGSAGQAVGLEVGDQIVSYDGERVFSLLDLQEATQTGIAGQTVIIEVMREQQSLSFAIPRGQIGISTGRAGFGFGQRRGN